MSVSDPQIIYRRTEVHGSSSLLHRPVPSVCLSSWSINYNHRCRNVFFFFFFLVAFSTFKIFLKFLKNKNVSTNVTRNSTLMLFSCRFLRYFKQMGNTTWKNYNARSTDSNTVCRKLRHFTSTDDGFRHVFLNFHAFNVSYFFSNVSSLHLWLQHTHSDSECWRDGRERLSDDCSRQLIERCLQSCTTVRSSLDTAAVALA